MYRKLFSVFFFIIFFSWQHLFAQVNDNFSDGDFTSAPTWTGSDADFVVTPYILDASNLMLRSNSSVAATYYLSTPNNLLSNIQWDFFMNLRFSTSGSNLVDVFLVADDSELTNVLNGYFLRVGRTQDDISFWKRQSGVDVILIDGVDGQVGSSTNNPFVFRILRTDDGLWTILVDEDGSGSYVELGSITDTNIATTAAFGFLVVQSSAGSVINGHWFDDISVGEIPMDESPPLVLSAEASSLTQIEILFDEAVDVASAGILSNYSLDGGIGNPSQAAVNAENSQQVDLLFAEALQNGQSYILTVQGVQDLVGNVMIPQNFDILYFEPAIAEFRDIVINELMADPTPIAGMPDAEFIELFNSTTDKFFDLSGWVLVNTTTSRTLGSGVIPPGGHIILCNTTNTTLFEPFSEVLGIASFVALSNDGDSLTLLNPDGELIDAVSYELTWYNDAVKDDGGYTLEQINPFAQCSGIQNWSATNSIEGGTPGAQNSIFDDTSDIILPTIISFSNPNPEALTIMFSEAMDVESLQNALFVFDQGLEVLGVQVSSSQLSATLTLNQPLQTSVLYTIGITGPLDCAGNALAPGTVVEVLLGEIPEFGDLVINEIMADPTPALGLPAQEYFELFNVSNKVLQIQNCAIDDRLFAAPRILMPGEYLLCVSSSVIADFADFPNVYAVQSLSTSFFTNDGREVSLFNPSGDVIYSVTYSLGFYKDTDKDDGGWSLEVINPFAPCSGIQNWSASEAIEGGTPGTQNSVFDTTPDTTPPIVTSFEVLSGIDVRIYFNEIMDEVSLLAATYAWNQGIQTASVVPDEGLISVTLSLTEPIEIGDEYTLTINGPADCAGNLLPLNTLVEIQIGESPMEFDVLITEIMADPSPVVALPDAEYFELYNASEKVLELIGCTIAGVPLTANRVMQPGEYLLCTSSANAGIFSDFPHAYFIDNFSTTFLTNTGRELLFTNAGGEQVDRVNYDISWYRDAAKDDGGWSLERINLEEPCRLGDNWIASTAAIGGTPASQNAVLSTQADMEPPIIVSVFAVNSNAIEVRFNEAVDQLIATMAIIDISGIEVESLQSIGPEHTAIMVSLINPLVFGQVYDMFVSGIADCTGNLMVAAGPLPIALPQEGDPGDIIINEVLFNPRDGGVDFVEIVNVSSKAIGLQDWVLQNQDGSSRVISVDPIVIFPGAYAVLTSSPEIIASEYPTGNSQTFVRMADGTPSFSNSSGTVVLADPELTIVDRFDYFDSYHLSLLQSVKGVSLERLSFTRPTNDSGNWTSAAEVSGFATPGYLNSQYAPEIESSGNFTLQNEVFSPDNDGFDDVLLINYKLDFPGAIATVQAYDRRGRLIRTITNNTPLATEGTLSWDGTTDDRSKARIGPHIIYVDIFDTTGRTQTFKLGCVVAGRLNN